MKKTYVTTIPQEVMANLQRLNYEVAQHDRNLRMLIIEGGADIVTSEAYKHYKNEGMKLNFELEETKAHIEKAVLPEGWWNESHQYTVFMNYLSNEVTVEVSDAAGIKRLEEEGYVLK